MKNILLLIILLSLCLGCEKEKEIEKVDDVITRWILIAQYFDPGDGSGDIETLNSNKNIEFLKSGKVRSNGNLCNLGSDLDGPTEAKQAIKDPYIILNADNCPEHDLYLYFKAPDTLDIYYPCDEACFLRFKKIK